MAEIVMVLGESGSGKSASLRNFNPGEVCVLNVAGKRLPFRNSFGKHVVNVGSAASIALMYDRIKRAVRSGMYKVYVIDDSQYLMAFDAFDRAEEKGYGKFTDMAKAFYDLLRDLSMATIHEKQEDGTYVDTRKRTDDVIVYFLHHPDRDDSGLLKPKTQGRMLWPACSPRCCWLRRTVLTIGLLPRTTARAWSRARWVCLTAPGFPMT